MNSPENQLIQHDVQLSLGLEVATIKTIEDAEYGSIEMGVFKNGVGFMSGRALARMCGVSESSIRHWAEKGAALDGSKIGETLSRHGFEGAALSQKIAFEGREISAYPENVCLAFLEYYAFEAEERYRTTQAVSMFRRLAGVTLHQFIYTATGYTPTVTSELSWKAYQDRHLLNKIPSNYFSVFTAASGIQLEAIRAGLTYDDTTVPDISLGIVWSKFWATNNLEAKYGARVKYPHKFPDYYRQSAANDFVEVWIYPVVALGEFMNWLNHSYLVKQFPDYMRRKAKEGAIDAARVELLIKAVEPKILGAG